MSLVLIVGILHPVFAQDFGTSKSSNSAGGTSNKGATGAGTKSSDATEPDLVLYPTSGPPGGTFGVHATQLSHNSQVMIDNPFSGVSHGNADQYGNFVTTITVPKGTPPGTYHVKLEGITGSKTYAFADVNLDEIFTVTGQDSKTTNVNVGHPNPSPPPPPPPKPPQSQTTPTNTATGGSSELPYITLDPTSGYPGTVVKIKGGNFVGEATLSVGGKVTAKSSDTNLNGDSISEQTDGSLSGVVTIPESAPPGPLPIQVDSSAPDAKAIFNVLKKPTIVNAKTTPALQSSTDTTQTNSKSNALKKGTLGTGTVASSTSGANSNNPSNPAPSPPPIAKRSDENGKPMDSGASFSVFKTVVGGDAIPADFKFNLILTGSSGTAQYPIGPAQGQGNPSETLPFNLDLPKGNTLSEGSFQIVETNPGDYIPTYSKGCSGSYDNDGYFYTCSITNTKKVVPNTVSSVANGPKPPLPQPTITPPVSSTTGKSTPTVTLPKTTGKTTLPTTPSKPTSLITPSKSTGTIVPKIPSVKSCPTGSFATSGKCISKGAVVAILQ